MISKHITRNIVKIWAKTIILFLQKILNIKVIFNNKFIKKNKGILIAANHQSAFDTIFLAAFDKAIYIIKKELKFIPIYGWYAIRLGNIFIDRSKKVESIKKLSNDIRHLINQGYKVVIFPEGTRQAPKQIGEIKPGVFLLQFNLKEPIYPVYIDSGDAWPKNSMKMKTRNIFIKALKPIPHGLNKIVFKKKLYRAFKLNVRRG